MRTNLLLLLLITFLNNSLQAQQSVYTNSVVNLNSSFVLPDANNANLVFGQTTFLSKVDAAGNILWSKNYAFVSPVVSNQRPQFLDATRDLDSNLVVIGATNEASNNAIGFCMKLKKNGDTLWCRRLKDSAYINFIPRDVQVCKDSGYVLCGVANHSVTPSSRLFVAKFTKKGQLSWMKTYTSSFYSSEGAAIKQTSDTNFIFTGAKQVGSNVDWDIMTGKLSNNGQPLWAKQLDNPSESNGTGTDLHLFQGHYMLLAHSGFPGLLSISNSGTLHYQMFLNGYAPHSNSLHTDFHFSRLANKHYLIVSRGINNTSSNWIMETDTSGNLYWQNFLQLMHLDALQNADKTFTFIGNRGPALVQSKTSSFGQADYQITKADSLGNSPNACMYSNLATVVNQTLNISSFNFSATAVGLAMPIHPTVTVMNTQANQGCIKYIGGLNETNEQTFQLFPNPANQQLHFQTNGSMQGNLHFLMFNSTGSLILEEEHKASTNGFTIHLPELPAGLYFYQIRNHHVPMQNGKVLINQNHR